MSKNLLFVSIAFPPKNDPECVQAGRYAFYLKKNFDWNITIVTSKIPTLFMPYDESLERFSKDFRYIEILIFENKYINKLISIFIPKLLNQPDSKFSFFKQWKRVIKKYDKPDIIYSRSFPLSSALMALKLKEHYNVPWIMHLSDPWVESPLHGMKNKYHRLMEMKCFEKANYISFTTKEALDLYVKKYPDFEKKFFVSTNVYEDISINPVSNQRHNESKLKIVYTGGLASTRTAKHILEALSKAIDIKPELMNIFELVFAGDVDRNNLNLFKKYKSIRNLKYLGPVTSKVASQLQDEADFLIVIDSKIREKDKNVFLPSKLLDYACKVKRIIAITDSKSPTAKFIEKYGGKSFYFDDETALVNFFLNIDNYKDIEPTRVPQEFSISFQSNILNRKLISLKGI